MSVVLCVVLLAASCGGSSDASTDIAAELDAAESRAKAAEADATDAANRAADAEDEARSAQADLSMASTELAAREAELSQLQTRVDELESGLAESNTALAAVEADLEAANGELSEERSRADAAEDAVNELRARYDTELRADAQAAWDAEIAAACEEAGNGSSAVSRYVDFTEQLEIIGAEDELVELVTACAEPLRSRSEEEKLNAECSPGSIDEVIKAPDALAGNCYVIFVIPWQWDSRTGECNFLGSWDSSDLGTRRFNYDGDGVFRAPPSVCDDDLTEADQDDLLKVWVDLTGSFRYDTAAGGTNEIPDFQIRRAIVIAKA